MRSTPLPLSPPPPCPQRAHLPVLSASPSPPSLHHFVAGHISRDCTAERNESARQPRAPRAREERAPRARAPQSASGKTCYNCGQVGHVSADCTNERVEGAGGNRAGGRRCFNCGNSGECAPIWQRERERDSRASPSLGSPCDSRRIPLPSLLPPPPPPSLPLSLQAT